MKNEHLVPPPVLDMIEKLRNGVLMENERMALIQRLEVTRDAIIRTLEQDKKSKKWLK